ncbi:KR domain-containing protein (plasmid) [Streptomyces sp. BI20]|uniref:KR domain-containing protein n=1 Tax=Streptomyces sp. BI20 TaxID=3403460 RepID=UPI003C77AE01
MSVEAPPSPRRKSPDTAAPESGAAPVRRVLWRLSPAAPASGPGRLDGRRAVVLGGAPGLARRVRDRLRELGARVEDEPGAEVPDTIVDLTMAEPYDPETPGAWREPLLRTFEVLRRCHGAWSEEERAGRLRYLAVTYLGGGMGRHPEDDVAQPLGGLWAGLAKTLHRELPACEARVVDVPLGGLDELPEIVARELATSGLIEIGHRDDGRWTLRPEAVAPGPAEIRWDASDTVLISGGGRGIGMALARRLAAVSGARVIVTGRAELPPEEEWAAHTPRALAARTAALWGGRGPGRSVAAIRADIARAEQTWETVGALREAAASGARVEYRRCDVTDPEQVGRLVADLPGLTGVVHNAGLDRPTRLPGKSDADVLAVVATKVDAFGHLFRAVRDLDLKVFCTVGSLTGRLGGMVGQFDYAAANECLARLGCWARRRARFPVMTLAWPTWARLGLIANFEASLRYMAAMDVAEGLDHWMAELGAGTSGEVSFVGPLGPALSPSQAVGHPLTEALPGHASVLPKIFHLGVPERYRPQRRLVSRISFDPGTSPAVGDFTVGGAPAVPVGVLLESAVRGAEWVLPTTDAVPRSLLAIEGLSVPWSLLAAGPGGSVRLRRDVRFEEDGDRWTVLVAFEPVDGPAAGPAGEPVRARMRLRYGRRPEPDGPPAPPPGAPGPAREGVLLTGVPLLAWRGLAVPQAPWRVESGGRMAAEVTRCRPADLWAVPAPPACAVPVAEIENVVRAVTSRLPGIAATPDPLILHRVELYGGAPRRTRVTGDTALGVWRITDAADGAPVAVVHRDAHPLALSPTHPPLPRDGADSGDRSVRTPSDTARRRS